MTVNNINNKNNKINNEGPRASPTQNVHASISRCLFVGIHNCYSDAVGGKRWRKRFHLRCLHGHISHVNKNISILSGSSNNSGQSLYLTQ